MSLRIERMVAMDAAIRSDSDYISTKNFKI